MPVTKLVDGVLTGGCLCGGVKYEVRTAPVFSANCHCRDCQRATGSGYAPFMMVSASALRIVGRPRVFEARGDNGERVLRHFCETCGSNLLVELPRLPGLIGVRPGTLDDPNAFRPTLDLYTASAAPWDTMDAALAKFPGGPSTASGG